MREVAGPDAAVRAPLPEIYGYRHLVCLEAHEHVILIDRNRLALAADRNTQKVDIDLRLVEGNTALAGGGCNPAPVRVVAEDGALHERRVRDSTRYGLCRDLNLNKGNVYAYLAGDDSKVSRETARRIMEYAEERGTQEGAGRPVCVAG